MNTATRTEIKEFYNIDIDQALQECQVAGYTPLFMPQLVDRRIHALLGDEIWSARYTTPSIRATGRTKQGNPVVVYAHIENDLSHPENIKAARQNHINGAGILSQEEFERLLSLEGRSDNEGNQCVFVIDHRKFMKARSGIIAVEDALEHPQTIPFLGGQQQAETYLKRSQEIYGDGIGIWYKDDLHSRPVGRLLFLNYGYLGLNGDDNLDYGGRFVGVRTCAVGAPKIETPTVSPLKIPTLEDVLHTVQPYVPQACQDDAFQRLKKLYQQE